MNFKKLTSWLLTLVMMISLVPMAAFAEAATPTVYDGTISIYYDDTSSEVDKTSDTGSIEISTMFPQGNTACYYVGFSGDGTVSYSASSNTNVSENITNIFNNRYEIKIVGYGSSSYTFTITEGETVKTAVVNVIAQEAQSGGNDGSGNNSGNQPIPTTVTMCYVVNDTPNVYHYNAQETNHPNGIEIDATKETGYYVIKFFDENNNPIAMPYPRHSMDSDVVGFSGNDPMQPTEFTVIAKGINGVGYYNFENNNINFGCQIKFTVTGNPENPYLSTTVVQAEIGSSKITVATNLSGELSNAAEGFALENGTLTFANTANAGSFDATVGGQLYTVVIFPAVNSMTDLTEDLTLKVNTDDSAITGYFGNSGFATEEYNIVTVENDSVVGINDNGREGMFGKDANGAYTPVYVYKTSDGALVDFDNSYFIQAVNAYVGKTSYLLKTEIIDINGKDVLKVYPLTEYAGTTVKKNTMVLGQLTITKNDGSVINQTLKTTDEEPELKGTNGFGGAVLWTEVGGGFANANDDTFYIKNGDIMSLYDVVDISTLKVQSTNSENVNVKEFITTKGTDNVIGFKVSVAGFDKFMSELIKVSFKNKTTGADEYFYIPVICRDKEEALSITITPEQAESLQGLYDSFPGTELYLEEGEYATDLYMWRGNLKVVGLGNGVVFTGSADTATPILTVGYDTYVGEDDNKKAIASKDYFRFFTNIAVDGKTKTKTGYKAEDGITINLMKSAETNGMGLDYINNCNVAILATNEANSSTVNIYGLTFKNNNVAIQVGHSLGYAVVGNHTKEILENNFIGNTTDFKVTDASAVISIPQNFYADAHGAMKQAGPAVDGTANVDYMPYYTTADRDTVQAQISPSATVADEATELEIPVTLMQTDKAVKLDKTLFEQINSAATEYKVSVPVREKGDKIYSVWNFDSTKLAATQPDATVLKVTNTLGDGESLYETIDTTKTDVKQVVNFAHSGNLPGETVVHVLKDDATVTADGLKLYYLDVTNNKIVEADFATVTESADGKYWIVTVDHCSEYIISTAVVLEETGDDNTGSGDGTGEGTSGSTGGNSGSSSSSNSSSNSTSTTTPAPTATPAATKAPTAVTTTPSANDFVSAVEVEEKMENAAGTTVTVDVSAKELVSAKAFEILAENPDKELVFETDEYKWTFAASDIIDTDAIEGTTFKPAISLESPNVDAIKALVGDVADNFTHIYFEHHGKLPGKAKIEIFVGEDQAGLTKYVYHHIPERNGFEYIETITLTEKGWAEFEIYGCSDYILSDVMLEESLVLEVETETETEPTTSEKEETNVVSPVEEETISLPIIPIVLVIVVAAIIVFVLIRKKKEE